MEGDVGGGGVEVEEGTKNGSALFSCGAGDEDLAVGGHGARVRLK